MNEGVKERVQQKKHMCRNTNESCVMRHEAERTWNIVSSEKLESTTTEGEQCKISRMQTIASVTRQTTVHVCKQTLHVTGNTTTRQPIPHTHTQKKNRNNQQKVILGGFPQLKKAIHIIPNTNTGGGGGGGGVHGMYICM